MSPEDVLSVLLSNKQVVISSSTTQHLPSTHDATPRYRCVGAGSCGVIYEHPGTSFAFKLAGHDNPQLWNDYKTHARVLASFNQHRELITNIHVPQCHLFIRPDDADCLLPPHLCSQARTDPLNADCLARIYLGRRRRRTETGTARPQWFLTLRNFPLHLDQMLDLNLDIDSFARTMAAALAVMHWAARTDADDVKFVLGGNRPLPSHVRALNADAIWAMPQDTSTLHSTTPPHTSRTGGVRMWFLDFNHCGTISMDEVGVEKAVKAFYKNDPYFPRPGDEGGRDQELWETFRGEYLRASEMVLGDGAEEWRVLPRRFVERVEGEQRARLVRRVGETASGEAPED